MKKLAIFLLIVCNFCLSQTKHEHKTKTTKHKIVKHEIIYHSKHKKTIKRKVHKRKIVKTSSKKYHKHIVATTAVSEISSDFITLHEKKSFNNSPHLYSYSAYVINANTQEVVVSKNPDIKLPIASITKLMTAITVLDSEVNLDDLVTISQNDVDTLRKTFSRLRVGSQFQRRELLLLALMSSENRAAHALARTTYPYQFFINKMNSKANFLGMTNTHFDDPTGLSITNTSTAKDLSRLVVNAFKYDLIRKFTTTKSADIALTKKSLHHYVNSDSLVRADNSSIQIVLSKTGFINEAGHCLVLYSIINDEPYVMVFLNSTGKSGRILDALAVKNYIKNNI